MPIYLYLLSLETNLVIRISYCFIALAVVVCEKRVLEMKSQTKRWPIQNLITINLSKFFVLCPICFIFDLLIVDLSLFLYLFVCLFFFLFTDNFWNVQIFTKPSAKCQVKYLGENNLRIFFTDYQK